MIVRDTNIQSTLRSRQRGFLLNPFRFSSGGGAPVDPHWANVVLLLPCNDTLDRSSYGRTMSITSGASITSANQLFGQDTLLVPGEGQGLLTTGSEMVMDTDFTIEFHVCVLDAGGAYGAVIASRNASNGPGSDLIYRGTNGCLYLSGWTSNTGGGGNTTNAVSNLVWHHVAFGRQGTVLRSHVDGVFQSSSFGSGAYNYASNGGTSIGRNAWDGGNGYVNAQIANVRVTKGVCRYPEANITPPSGPYPTSGP